MDNSVCNDLQNLPTNLIENSENFQNLSYANVEQSGAPENSQTTQKLSKQNSLEKTVPSISAGSADSTTNNSNTRHGGLTQSSIADLEKKLAALRNAEIPDEVYFVMLVFIASTIYILRFIEFLLIFLQQQLVSILNSTYTLKKGFLLFTVSNVIF